MSGFGDLVVLCRPAVVVAAVVRRDGRVQAAGHPADHVRLGILEHQLDQRAVEPNLRSRGSADNLFL
jgi:hypothetical protein